MTASSSGKCIEASSAAMVDVRIAELENELNSTREDLVILKNQNDSLQTSLNLVVGENLRLRCDVADNNAKLGKARSQIEQLRKLLEILEAGRGSHNGEIDGRKLIGSKPADSSAETLLAHTIMF
jgi:chromosome segregation ATPase